MSLREGFKVYKPGPAMGDFAGLFGDDRDPIDPFTIFGTNIKK